MLPLFQLTRYKIATETNNTLNKEMSYLKDGDERSKRISSDKVQRLHDNT